MAPEPPVEPAGAAESASEAIPRELLHGLEAIVWSADPPLQRFSYVSLAAAELLRYPVEQWLTEPGFFSRHLHPEDRATVLSLCQAVHADGRERLCIHRMIAADGSVRWFHTSVHAAPGAAAAAASPPGRGRELAGVMLDITEAMHGIREWLRRAVQEEGLLASIAEGVLVLDAHGSVIYANEAASRLMGVPLPEALPQPVALFRQGYRLCRPDGTTLPEEERLYDRALRGETFSGVELLVVPRGEGARHSVRFSGAPLRDAEGRVAAVVLILHDGPGQGDKTLERGLLHGPLGRRVLHAVLDVVPDMVSVWSTDRRLVLLNQAGLDFLKARDLEEARRMIEPDCRALLPLCDPAGLPLPAEDLPALRALAGESVVTDGLTFRHPVTGRDVRLRVHAHPVRDHGGKIVAVVQVTQDVTVLAELDRLKDQFVRVAAHELKTPVTVVKGYAQALLSQAREAPAPQREKLEAIVRGADRIDRLIRDILDILQLTRGRLRLALGPVDLPALVAEAIRVAAATTRRHRLLLRADPVVVEGDRRRLLQVLDNLLGNAIKFSPDGGDIEVEVTVQGGDAQVLVRDHGVGISPERLARVFEDFYRAHAETPHDYGGIGLGLYLVQELVALHGGRVWAQSEEGQGSVFAFCIPRRS